MSALRSRSLKHAPPAEMGAEAAEGSRMSVPSGCTVYCCIARGTDILYSYSSRGSDAELEAAALQCLHSAPPLHQHYFLTVGSRTFGFLMADGDSYFAIIDPSTGSAGALEFLCHVRSACRTASKAGFSNALLAPIIHRMAASLEKKPQGSSWLDDAGELGTSSDGSGSSQVLLLGRSGSRKDKKKARDAAEDGTDQESCALRINMPPSDGTVLERSMSQGRIRRQQSRSAAWWRKVRIVVLADVVLCLLLFGIWMAVCKGFRCVTTR